MVDLPGRRGGSKRPHLAFDAEFNGRCADYFYRELFELIPGSREMFSEPERQRVMFATLLSVITRQAANRSALDTTLRNLGRKHQEMGVNFVHLKIARDAFLKAVEMAAPDLTDAERGFFESSYEALLDSMR